MNSQDSWSNDTGRFSTGRSNRTNRVTANILKALLILGVTWVALTVAFTVVGALTADEIAATTGTSTSPTSQPVVPDNSAPVLTNVTPVSGGR